MMPQKTATRILGLTLGLRCMSKYTINDINTATTIYGMIIISNIYFPLTTGCVPFATEIILANPNAPITSSG